MNLYRKIIGVGILQLLVLFLMIGGKLWQVAFGDRVLVEIEAYDPRSLFRGYYSRIDPVFADSFEIENTENIRLRQALYAPYTLNDDGVAEFVGITFDKPETGKFLQGEVANIDLSQEKNYIFRDPNGKEYRQTEWYGGLSLKEGQKYVLCVWNDNDTDFYVEKSLQYQCSTSNTRVVATLVTMTEKRNYTIRPNFYIEAFYKSHVTSQEIEQKLWSRQGKAYAEVAVSGSGKPTIVALIIEGQRYQ